MTQREFYSSTYTRYNVRIKVMYYYARQLWTAHTSIRQHTIQIRSLPHWGNPRETSVLGFHESTLKWKSQEITKANTMHASSVFMTRRPCQKFWFSATAVGAAGAMLAFAVALFASLVCSPTTLSAVAPQISQVLRMIYAINNRSKTSINKGMKNWRGVQKEMGGSKA